MLDEDVVADDKQAKDVEMDVEKDAAVDTSALVATVSATATAIDSDTGRARRNIVPTPHPDAVINTRSEVDSDHFSEWDMKAWNRRLSDALEESRKSFRPLAETLDSIVYGMRGNGLGFVDAAAVKVLGGRTDSGLKRERTEDDERAVKKRNVGKTMARNVSSAEARMNEWLYDAKVTSVDGGEQMLEKEDLTASEFVDSDEEVIFAQPTTCGNSSTMNFSWSVGFSLPFQESFDIASGDDHSAAKRGSSVRGSWLESYEGFAVRSKSTAMV